MSDPSSEGFRDLPGLLPPADAGADTRQMAGEWCAALAICAPLSREWLALLPALEPTLSERLQAGHAEDAAAVLTDLLRLGLGWQPEGRTQEAHRAAVETALAEPGWDGLRARLASVEAGWRQRVQRLEQRLVEGERGALRTQRATLQVVQLLNARTEGRSLPPGIIDLLHGPWREALNIVLLREGEQSGAWRDAVRTTNNLMRSCQPVETDAQRQALYRLLDGLPDTVAALLRVAVAEGADVDRHLQALSQVHLALLQEKPLPAVPVPRLALHTPIPGVALQIGSEWRARAEAATEGGWWLMALEDGREYHRLAARLPEGDSLLFTNWLGQRSERKTVDELAFGLASGSWQPLQPADWVAETLAGVVREARARLAAQQAAREDARRRADEAQRRLAEIEARRQAEAAAREQARLKAEAEARRLEALAAEQARQARERLQAERQLAAVQQVEQLSIGSWVDLPGSTQPRVRAKLAVKIPSSGKLIFVDRIGVKVAELQQAELIAMLANGQASVHKTESRFEDTLVKVVDQLRRERRE